MVFHTFISLDLFGAQWADTNNGGPMGNNLVGEEGSSLGFGSYDSRVSGANQLPAGMTATAWGSGPHYGNMGGRMVFPIPTGAGNLHSYPRSEWGREGTVAWKYLTNKGFALNGYQGTRG
mmetsp:Transcript_20826/g.32634  ORF Transcript_20826/g.32634 Transcript_20826/m.32634 type:complete len:120 (+) Transcript_20826:208-567(+)